MRIIEILLPKGSSDRSLSPQTINKIDALQQRMDQYVDKIMNPGTSGAGKEFLKSKLRDDYYELKGLIKPVHRVAEAVHKLPLSHDDFEVVIEVMKKPIPAAIAPIYLSEIIEDDELNDQIKSIEDTDPSRDIRPLIAEWFNRVMPDQMYRFTGDHQSDHQKKGVLSPIHGYDPKMYKGTNDPITGNAFGSR